jgi:hypothetical protein
MNYLKHVADESRVLEAEAMYESQGNTLVLSRWNSLEMLARCMDGKG